MYIKIIENNNHFNLILHTSENKLIKDLNFNLVHNLNNNDSNQNYINNNYDLTEQSQIAIHSKKFLIENDYDDDNSEKINEDNTIYLKKKTKRSKKKIQILKTMNIKLILIKKLN